MYYDYIRINAVIDRRRDMLVYQTTKDGLYEAFYPHYNWLINWSEHNETIVIPIVPPRGFIVTQANEGERLTRLFQEMDALTRVKRILNKTIYMYQKNMTWRPGYPMDSMALGFLHRNSMGKTIDDFAIEVFSDREMNKINATFEELDACKFWGTSNPNINLWTWRLAEGGTGSLKESVGTRPRVGQRREREM
jgi:hypothetical protein